MMFREYLIVLTVVLGLTACQSEETPSAPNTEVLADSGSREGTETVDSDSEPTGTEESIGENELEIVSVTPDQVVEGGQVSVAVTVRYSLASTPQGQISVGYNVELPSEYISVSAPVVVEQGVGEVVIETEVVPVLWSDPEAFAVNVILSEYPHSSAWEPLLSVQQPITVEPYIYQPGQSTYAQHSAVDTPSVPSSVCYAANGPDDLFCIGYTF